MKEPPGTPRVVPALKAAACLIVIPSVSAVLFDLVRPGGIPLFADTDYRDEILVPCPENLKEARPVYLDTLPKRLDGLTVVDARSAAAFAGGHAAGAVNIPHRSLNTGDEPYRKAIRDDLAPLAGIAGRTIVVCGDPGTDSGRSFAALLLEHGFEGVRYVVEGCEAFEAAGHSYERPRHDASPIAAVELPEDLAGWIVVDARLSPRAFRKGHLPGAVRLPASKVEGPDDPRLAALRDARNSPLLVYGSADREEGQALARLLRAAGWNDVRYIEGGIEAWVAAGRSLEEGGAGEESP
ncbi:MAG: rhodanese-like domain-containing protein [Myxococcota bacterium]|nr:rhodanese-like domain-containing protein [Myxococcota bacterium]